MAKRKRKIPSMSIPDKANRILNIILIGLLLIGVRVWHMAVIQHDAKLDEAEKPRNRLIIEPAKRATIRDRFNIPLAINKMEYQGAVVYADIQEIPSISWEAGQDGKKVKVYKRRQYIEQLSKKLGDLLSLDPQRVEDIIYSKAVFYHQIPFVLKKELSEEEYYRLKMMEKDWPGALAMKVPRRTYPNGKLGGELIGYVGAINREEYEKVIHEMQSLREILDLSMKDENLVLPLGYQSIGEVKRRLKDLEDYAYSINDYVGKSGIEGYFEEQLRGYCGKKRFYVDAKGNLIRELPGNRAPQPGQRLLLSISKELQEYAEKLLAGHEKIRMKRRKEENLLWMRGGAIVAMDPKTGEILAMATHPGFDPNDFISSQNPEIAKEKINRIHHWFETESYLEKVWNRELPLEREFYSRRKDQMEIDRTELNWEKFLSMILPEKHAVRKGLETVGTIGNAVSLQRGMKRLLEISGQNDYVVLIDALYFGGEDEPFYHKTSKDLIFEVKTRLEEKPIDVYQARKMTDPYLKGVKENYNKLFLCDLCRVVINEEKVSKEVEERFSSISLERYRTVEGDYQQLLKKLWKREKVAFHDGAFHNWREDHQQEYLRAIRKKENAEGRYNKPYLDHLDRKEAEMFRDYWEENKWNIVLEYLENHPDYPLNHVLGNASPLSSMVFLQTFRTLSERDQPLWGRYLHLRGDEEKHLALSFYPRYGFGHARSHAFRQAAPQGSIFKVVTAYASLMQRYRELYEEKGGEVEITLPLVIHDEVRRVGNGWSIGYFSDGKPIPRLYKGGRMPKSLSRNIGRTDLFRALETSSNPYFALLAGDYLEEPSDLINAAKDFSYGMKTGVDLPGEISGSVPTDVEENRTGLHALAIGQHSLVVSPLQTAVMLSSLVNGGKIFKPKIVTLSIGNHEREHFDTITDQDTFDFQENLSMIGIDFPLFSAIQHVENDNQVKVHSSIERWRVPMPKGVKLSLLKGMQKVVQSTPVSRFRNMYAEEELKPFKELKGSIIGKSSSAERMERIHFDRKGGIQKCTHMWFGVISFEEELTSLDSPRFHSNQYEKPELVVIVYLRHGHVGKDSLPVAAQMVKRWREIKSR